MRHVMNLSKIGNLLPYHNVHRKIGLLLLPVLLLCGCAGAGSVRQDGQQDAGAVWTVMQAEDGARAENGLPQPDAPGGPVLQEQGDEDPGIPEAEQNGAKTAPPETEEAAETEIRPIPGDARFDEYLPLLAGKRVALYTNQTAVVGDETDALPDREPGYDLIPFGYDRAGREITYGPHILDALIARGADVRLVFAPEHGFRGPADAGAQVADSVDEATGVPVRSLYGSKNTPAKEDLEAFDVLVADIQDVGLRYYTYYITLYRLMDACAGAGKAVILLDRPNPNGSCIDGPILQDAYKSSVGALPIPVVHGMTLGELACMINGEGWLAAGRDACDLTVIRCDGYTHDLSPCLICRPSPNLKDMRAVWLYASTCFFENTAVSVGRGTAHPFEIWGSPGLDPAVYPFSFIPESMEGALHPPFEGQACHGRDLREIPLEKILREGIDLSYLIEAYQAYHTVHPEEDFFGSPKNGRYHIDLLSGSDELRKRIIAGESAEEIKASWREDIESFRERRRPYLLYEE